MPGEDDAGIRGESAGDPYPWGMGAGWSKSRWRRTEWAPGGYWGRGDGSEEWVRVVDPGGLRGDEPVKRQGLRWWFASTGGRGEDLRGVTEPRAHWEIWREIRKTRGSFE